MRRILPMLAAALAFAVLSILWIITDRRAPQRIYDPYSSANTSERGTSLAAGYLARTRKVNMLTRPVGRQPLERNAVVIRISEVMPFYFDPSELGETEMGPPKPKAHPLLSQEEETFVRGGGRMIVAASEGLLPMEVLKEPRMIHKVFPVWPAVQDLDPKNCDCEEELSVFISLRPDMHALFVAGNGAVLARERIGAGDVFVLSTPDMFLNEYLSRGHHLALLSALAGEGRPVYFDEVLHGIVTGEGALALMKDWNLGPFLLLLALLALLVFWREGRRIGPPDDDERETRSDAIDLVRSLGALYHEVTTDAEAVSLYHGSLTRTIAHQSGLRGDALRKRVDELTRRFVPPVGKANMPKAVFKRQLGILNEAYAKLKER